MEVEMGRVEKLREAIFFNWVCSKSVIELPLYRQICVRNAVHVNDDFQNGNYNQNNIRVYRNMHGDTKYIV